MKSTSVLLIGCGDIGTRIGLQLVERGCIVAAVRRRSDKLPQAFAAHAVDYTEPGSLDFVRSLQPNIIVATFNPFDRSENGYRRGFDQGMQNLLSALGDHRPLHTFMASSTRVYAEQEGGWVEEDSPLTTVDPWASAIIDAERALLDSIQAASVVRFAGIYGNPGGRLLSRISRGEICPREPLRYTNRIHREDCADFLVHLIELAERGEQLADAYIGADNDPAARYEVESWLASQLGVSAAPDDCHEPIRHNAGHKRCRNKALRESGYKLRYPDYRAGYGALLGTDAA